MTPGQLRIRELEKRLKQVEIVILLAGGDKSTQSKDIQTALQLSKELKF